MLKQSDILDYIDNAMPQLQRIYNVWYALESDPDYTIRISNPAPFDDYTDIISKVSVLYKDHLVWEVLLAQDTDLEKFCLKLLQKMREPKER